MPRRVKRARETTPAPKAPPLVSGAYVKLPLPPELLEAVGRAVDVAQRSLELAQEAAEALRTLERQTRRIRRG